MSRVVVVGAGLAGARTCAELRAAGYRGDLALIGAEAHLPYDRPPLSKDILAGRSGVSGLRDVLGLDIERLAVDFRPGLVAQRLELAASLSRKSRPTLDLGSSGYLTADAVVIATGGNPIVPVTMAGIPHVRTLRTIEDALELREDLGSGVSLVLVGAGWIGAEVAGIAAWSGASVTVLEGGPAPLSGGLPEAIAVRTLRWYAEAGVTLRTGSTVSSIDEVPHGVSVRTTSGAEVFGHVALLALGMRPNTAWLRNSPVDLDPRSGAVRVDAFGATATPGVFAVGDVVSRWAPRYGQFVPGGHWQDALDQPINVAGAVMRHLGLQTENLGPYDAVPYMWSEQFGRTIQVVGRPLISGGRIIWREDATPDVWTGCVVTDSARGVRLHAVVGAGRPRDALQARRVLSMATLDAPVVDEVLLGDPLVPLRDAIVS